MTTDPDWINRYNEMVGTYQKESDRAAAILGASFMESILAETLKGILVKDPIVADLFEGYGPLSSLKAKIDIAFALGLLTPQMKADWNLIRKIRNHFAHHPLKSSFDDRPVKDFCANLSAATGIPMSDGNEMRKEKPREQYLFTVAINLALLDRAMRMESRRKLPEQGLVTTK